MESPSAFLRERAYTLSRSISAIQALPSEEGERTRLGLITQLPAGAEITVRDKGFSERTVLVRCSGASFFVFVEDIGELEKHATAAHA